MLKFAPRMRVAVAMSGGVDSSVAAWLLASQGHEVQGIYMRNWDEVDEHGECQADKDWEDVRRVVRQLPGTHPTPVEVNFVKEYWNGVFSPFIDGYATGRSTPNPDVACNREIKFGALLERALSMPGVEAVATGHYARVVNHPHANTFASMARSPLALPRSPSSSSPSSTVGLMTDDDDCAPEVCRAPVPQLWTAFDLNKDQTYFLSQVRGDQLRRVLFPLGELKGGKRAVRELAERAGLATALKRESMGICFIGKRRFRDFLGQYVSLTPGRFLGVVGDEHDAHYRRRTDNVLTKRWGTAASKKSSNGVIATNLSGSAVGGGGGGSGCGPTEKHSVWSGLLDLGPHLGLESYTLGQRAGVGGVKGWGSTSNTTPTATSKEEEKLGHGKGGAAMTAQQQKQHLHPSWFVCARDTASGAVLVCPGSDHPALFTDELTIAAEDFLWVDRNTTDSPTHLGASSPPHSLVSNASTEKKDSKEDDDGPRLRAEEAIEIFLRLASESTDPASHPSKETPEELQPSSFLSLSVSNLERADSPHHPQTMSSSLRCLFRARHRQELASCTVTVVDRKRQPSSTTRSTQRLQSGSGSVERTCGNADSLQIREYGQNHHERTQQLFDFLVRFDEPLRAVSPGQHVALYLPGTSPPRDGATAPSVPLAVAGGGGGDLSALATAAAASGVGDDNAEYGSIGSSDEAGDGQAPPIELETFHCLGGGPIDAPGPSYWELGKPLPRVLKP